ncbi:MAG: hypothetical protein ACREC4_00375 [Methylocella sp.]
MDAKIPSATAAKIIRVQGGNLFRIALDELGDALQWTRIAAINNLRDPFLPDNAQLTLIIPPVKAVARPSGILGG